MEGKAQSSGAQRLLGYQTGNSFLAYEEHRVEGAWNSQTGQFMCLGEGQEEPERSSFVN